MIDSLLQQLNHSFMKKKKADQIVFLRNPSIPLATYRKAQRAVEKVFAAKKAKANCDPSTADDQGRFTDQV